MGTEGFVPPRKGGEPYAKHHAVPVVRWQGRKNSKGGRVTRYGQASPGAKGTVMSATFQLDGQEFYAGNGGLLFSSAPAISFLVNCETRQEVDELREKLSAGGEKSRCGWLKDKYGLSWQIIPSVIGKMLQDKEDPYEPGFSPASAVQDRVLLTTC
jgi:predicted 3-demethylubiquinone-9 3-methyltransferase (glyoxalase superfamily)